jgi:hypothetical protein
MAHTISTGIPAVVRAGGAVPIDQIMLFDEGIAVVVDVPGEAQGLSPAQAAAMIRLMA